ncbi:MAG: serine/threonine protein kinase [Planctomycetota bacterium]|nr:serine/threonine protein kinase [Planctomycetota bacterium]
MTLASRLNAIPDKISSYVEPKFVGNGLVATAVDSRDENAEVQLVALPGSLGETVAYDAAALSESSLGISGPVYDDGFPQVDDLADSLLGQYQLGSIIGRGSMGRVYRAEHLGLKRPCAIKVMNPGLVERQPQIVGRFWAEARAAARVLHPHVVTIHNLGTERGYHFIEMEYIPGGVSLGERLIKDGPFGAFEASVLVRQVASALDAAHEAGLIHRDVKPANVLLTAAGEAKLADFGLVRQISELERAGVPIAGTPTYMAPELFEGVPASRRSDIYAVGVMYYYLLSARLPFASEQLGRLVQLHRQETPLDLRTLVPDVPDAALAVLERALAKNPADRYATTHEMAVDLKSIIVGLRDADALVRECIEGLDCFVQEGKDTRRILFALPGDRIQEVYIEICSGEPGERQLEVFSVCGPADPIHYEFALRLNARMAHGSLSIREVDGQPMFVMMRTYSIDTVNPAEIRAALLEIARDSDGVEQKLSSVDIY